MSPFNTHNLFVWFSKAKIKDQNSITFGSSHLFCNPYGRGSHFGVIDREALKKRHRYPLLEVIDDSIKVALLSTQDILDSLCDNIVRIHTLFASDPNRNLSSRKTPLKRI